MTQNKINPYRYNDYNLDSFQYGQTDDQRVDNLHFSSDEFSHRQWSTVFSLLSKYRLQKATSDARQSLEAMYEVIVVILTVVQMDQDYCQKEGGMERFLDHVDFDLFYKKLKKSCNLCLKYWKNDMVD